jgi:hypothetical protein
LLDFEAEQGQGEATATLEEGTQFLSSRRQARGSSAVGGAAPWLVVAGRQLGQMDDRSRPRMPWPLLRRDSRSRVDDGELTFSSSAHPSAKKQVQFSSTECPRNYSMPSKIHHELQASYIQP